MPNEEGVIEEAVKDEVVEQETTTTDSAPEENNSPEEATDTDSQDESSEKQETEADETKEPKSKADQRKEQLQSEIDELEGKVDEDQTQQDPRNTEIRDLVARRNALRQQVQQKNAQAYQAPTVEGLLDQVNPETGNYYNQLEAKLAIMEHNQKIEAYNNEVAEAQLTLSSEAERALSDFPIFDEKSPEYKKELAQEVDQILGQALVFDQTTGAVIGSHVSPYALYKAVYDSAKSGTVAGQLKAQKATQQMLNTADSSGGAPQKEPSFDKLSVTEMEARLRKKGHDI